MENFRTFFEQNYQGTEAFISEIIEPVFGTAFNKADENLLKSFPTLKPAAERANIISIHRFGSCDLDVPMEFFDITLNDRVHLSQSRVYIQQLVRQIMQTYSAALIVFHYTDNELEWRVSYVSKGSNATDATSAKRYTYLMGRNQKCRTAAERFAILANKEKNEATITDAFSVETLTKQFYNELFGWYQWALSDDKGFAATYPNDTNIDTDDRRIDEHIIRLITRLMFVWFIKQKKLVPEKIFKTDELKNLLTAFDPTSSESGNYYNAILQNLFFATLNKPIDEREFATETNYQGKDEHYGIKTLFRDAKEGSWFKKSKDEIIDLFKEVPFLNGGLFECLDKENADGKIYYYDGFSRKAGRQKRAFLPNCLFFDPEKGIIPLLEKYNFTVEENTPSDVEVALDPELLGKVFENLLGAFNPETKETARKQSGSFYTPREIVNYMVDESLIAYLTTACPELEEASIRLLFNQDELAEELAQSSEKRNKLATAIRSAKILDPACGSGAFPMGMLNKMLDVIHKLTNNSITNYETKLHLIENCIYGIDIQTIAVQITKLRFFISLVCEQTPTLDIATNYGILALPNLETKFVSANTLIGLKKDFSDKLDLQNDELKVLKNQLLDIRHKHFSAPNVNEKHKLRKRDSELRKEIKAFLIDSSTKPNVYKIELLENQLVELKSQKKQYEGEKWEDTTLKPKQQVALDFGFDPIPETQPTIFRIDINKQKRDEIDASIKQTENNIIREKSKTHIDGFEDEAEKLAHWNPYDQNTSSSFFDPEWMFGIKEGFDVVIGNPPYFSITTKTENYESYQSFFNFSKGTDIYCLFFELGVNVLKKDGYLCYITSNQWLQTNYGKTLRKFFEQNTNPLKLINFGGFKVFKSATVDTSIVLLKKDICTFRLKACHFQNDFSITESIGDYFERNSVLLDNFNYEKWSINDVSFLKLNSKIKSKGLPLKDLNIEIFRGLLTGYNEAFIINEDIKNKLINEDFKSAEIIKPILRGRDVHKNYIEYKNLWLIVTKNGINIEEYPAILKHLESFEKIKDRGDQGENWYNLRSCSYYNKFAEPKIIYPETTVRRSEFYYDTEGFYIDKTCFMITGSDLLYLNAILSSSLMEWYLEDELRSLGKTSIQYSKQYIELISIPEILPENHNDIIRLNEIIKSSKKENSQSDTTELEQLIDNLVYRLYDLTYDEVKVVDPAFALTEEEYNNIVIE